jgi:hypothetical protein
VFLTAPAVTAALALSICRYDFGDKFKGRA